MHGTIYVLQRRPKKNGSHHLPNNPVKNCSWARRGRPPRGGPANDAIHLARSIPGALDSKARQNVNDKNFHFYSDCTDDRRLLSCDCPSVETRSTWDKQNAKHPRKNALQYKHGISNYIVEVVSFSSPSQAHTAKVASKALRGLRRCCLRFYTT